MFNFLPTFALGFANSRDFGSISQPDRWTSNSSTAGDDDVADSRTIRAVHKGQIAIEHVPRNLSDQQGESASQPSRSGDTHGKEEGDECFLQKLREEVGPHKDEVLNWQQQKNFEDFMGLFPVYTKINDEVKQKKASEVELPIAKVYSADICWMAKWQERQDTVGNQSKNSRYLLITPLNENWGALSQTIPNRTADWNSDLEASLQRDGCSIKMIRDYLNNPHVAGVITTSHQFFEHPKLIPIPIGIAESGNDLDELFKRMYNTSVSRKKLLMINFSDFQHRKQISEHVLSRFGGHDVNNTYGEDKTKYFDELRASKFVLCPPGLGVDTYRMWEASYLGTIPVIEKNSGGGWHHVLDGLPHLVVKSFDDVNPALLEAAYPKIVGDCAQYEFGRLRKSWWKSHLLDLVSKTLTWKMKEDGVHLETMKETMHDDGAPLSGARDGNSHEIAPRTFEELRCCDGCCSCLPHCVNFQGASQQKSESAGLKRWRLLELRAEERGAQKMKTQSPKAAAVDSGQS